VTWILGGATAIGLLGVVGLAFLMWKMAKGNRSDLKDLIKSTKELSESKAVIHEYEKANADRDRAISTLERELAGEREAGTVLREALDDAQTRLAESGDVVGASAILSGAASRLRVLSEVSPTEAAPTGEDSNGP
jgi:soluble cytochrome b562